MQKRRNTKAAKRFIRKLLSSQGALLRVMVTDKLGSYGAANREIGLTTNMWRGIACLKVA